MSRRELREAEKQAGSRRRGRGKDRAARTTVVAPVEAPQPIDPADIATAPLAAVESTPEPESTTESGANDAGEALEALTAAAPPVSEHPVASRARRASTGRSVVRRPAVATPAVRSTPPAGRVSLRRRVAQKTFPPVVMAAAAALLIGTSVPPSALFDPDAPPASAAYASIPSNEVESTDGSELSAAAAVPEEGQVLEMALTEDVAAPVASRDDWTVTTYAEMLRLKYGTRDFSYSTSGSGAVRWPFPVAVPISSGFGERVAPCRGCSSYHQGLDFTPGRGAPIYSIADGVVVQAEQGGGFGNHVLIDHVINGQKVTSIYAHMIWDSSPLQTGDTIAAGEFIGLVGSTGASTGAHLHFEVRIDGIAIDPFAWLTTNAS